MKKTKVAIIGSGNIGMDLLYKVKKSKWLDVSLLTNRSPSPRLQKAKEEGINTSDKGIEAIIENPDIVDIVFDSTTANAHIIHAPILKKLGKKVIDMTPAGVGTKVVPAFNMEENLDKDNINLISCGGQAVIPIIGAISNVVEIEYAESVNASSSISVGSGTRANIDEYTHHTKDAIIEVGKAKTAKAIIVINPAEPPITMHNTIFAIVKELDQEIAQKINNSIEEMVKKIESYVPGYNMKTKPQFDMEKRMVIAMVDVEGAGDYLPKYAGNLDIITQAGIAIAERLSQEMQEGGVNK